MASNLRTIRERTGWTHQRVADELAQVSGRALTETDVEAWKKPGGRRRRFDARELYLLSSVFRRPHRLLLPAPRRRQARHPGRHRPARGLPGNGWRAMRDAVTSAIQTGRLSDVRLNEAVARVLTLRGQEPRDMVCP